MKGSQSMESSQDHGSQKRRRIKYKHSLEDKDSVFSKLISLQPIEDLLKLSNTENLKRKMNFEFYRLHSHQKKSSSREL